MSACRSCGAAILWVENDVTGRKMPVDVRPDAEGAGNVVLLASRSADGTRIAHVLKAVELAERATSSDSRYVSHFVTCPNANAHRR